MISDQIREVEEAARFLTRVLGSFNEHAYTECKLAEHFTDEEYKQTIDTLTDFGNGIRIERVRHDCLKPAEETVFPPGEELA